MTKRLTDWLPDIRLSDETFARRHRALQIILWLTVPLLFGLALFGPHGQPAASGHAGHDLSAAGPTEVWVLISGVMLCAVLGTVVRQRRPATILVSTGLLLAAAALVPAGGGLTDLHFGFFVVLGLISIYQDWTVLAISIGLVGIEHLVVGLIAPRTIYSDPAAANGPLRWALLHASFVLAMCAVEVAYWRFAAKAQAEKDAIRSQADLDLRQSEERFRAIVQDSADVVHVIDGEGRISLVSPGVERVTGHLPDDLVGATYRSMIHADDQAKLLDADEHDSRDRRVEVRTQHADGTWHWHDVTLRDLTDHPAVRGVVANHRDITERRTFQEMLVHEASHDSLTGLSNRAAFLRGLGRAALDAKQRNGFTAVLFLDLDAFKQVNDTFGHDNGDALLVATARSLRRCVLGSDVVGRLGGDEFGIVLTEVHGGDDAVVVANRILADLRRPVNLPCGPVRPRASIGIAVSDATGTDTDELLRRADAAMYRAKREQGSCWRQFVPGVDDRDNDDGIFGEELRRAIVEGQLRLHYQPIVELADENLVGFEALVRWQHPTRGLLHPGTFIPAAEETGLIDMLDNWVLEHACAQMAEWRRQHPHLQRFSVSVNVAPHQLEQPALITDIVDILHRTDFDPRDLVVEVTESALVRDQSAMPQLNALNQLGIRVALDDFGTGYSSLRYLTRLPVDILKLDQHFVSELNGTPEGSAVAESVIRLGQILHLDVIAEGIEQPAQAVELTLLGARTGQGYLYAQPLPVDEVDILLATVEDRALSPDAGAPAVVNVSSR
jgi:diguanylate cyclase (GGDEF)-like protein/PAS domain S-box-containing protein